MKIFSKILAFSLLLTVVVSLFAILPAFAADSNVKQPEVVFDLDSYEDGEVTSNRTKITITKEFDSAGNDYWLIKPDALAGEPIGNKTGAYLNSKSGEFTCVGSTIVQGDNKNTDFLVVDFDIATDSNFISSLGLQTKFNKITQAYVKGSSYDEIYVNSAAGDRYSTELPSDEWVNITFIYDCRGEAAAWKAYAYINGYYAGAITAINAESIELRGFRFYLPDNAVYDNESLKLRDLTYTKFPVGWAGDMTDSLGKNTITLDYVDELSYYSEGYNAPRFDGKNPVATIQRGGEEIPVYNVYDLDANFEDNDVVTLHRNIDIPLVVNANDVTFITNGYTYNVADTSSITDWSGIGYIALDARTRGLLASGTLDEFKTKAVPNKSKPLVYIIFGDADLALRAQTIQANGYTVYDLNGYTLNFKPASAGRIFATAENGVVRFQNGKLTCSDITESIARLETECAFTLQNLNLSEFNSTGGLFDNRAGLVLLKNVNKYVSSLEYVIRLNPNTGLNASVVYDDVVFAADIEKQYHTAIMNRAADAVAYVAYKNCDIRCSDTVIYGYNNVASKLEMEINIFVSNSKLTSDSGSLFEFGFKKVPTAESKIDVDVDIIDSTIAGGAIHRVAHTDNTAPIDFTYDANITIEGNSAIDTAGPFLRVDKNHAGTTIDLYAEEGVKVLDDRRFRHDNGYGNIALYDLTTGQEPNIAHNGKNYIITLSEFDTITYFDYKNQTEKAIPVIKGVSVDSAIKTLRRTESVGEYDAYRWKQNDAGVYEIDVIPNFNISANLALYKDISLNIFINRVLDSEDLAAVEFSVIGADKYTVSEYNGQTKIQVVVTPENIDKEYTVQVKIKEWNTEAYTSELPVTREIKISVASYCDNMIDKYGDKTELVDLMKAIKAYGKAVANYGNLVGDESISYGDPKAPADTEAFEKISLNLTSGFIWEIKVASGVKTVVVNYYYDGEAKEVELTPNQSGNIHITLKAFDLDKDITISANGEYATFNFAFYAEKALEIAEDKNNLKGLLDAIWTYATAAAAYKATN